MLQWLVEKIRGRRKPEYDVVRQPIYIDIDEGRVTKIDRNLYMIERKQDTIVNENFECKILNKRT